MLPQTPPAAFARPSQVILGSVAHHEAPSPSAAQKLERTASLPRDHIAILAGRQARDSLTAQASFDQVCILSRDQRFDQALPFWDAFSGSQDFDRCISCIAIGLSADQDHILLAAAMDHRIAVWYAPATASSSSRRWKVHSTLTVQEGVVTTLDIVNGQLLSGSTSSLVLWRLDSSDIPIWRRFWTRSVPAPIALARFSPDATSIAAIAKGGQNILIWQHQPRSTRPPVLQQRLYHARSVNTFVWRQPPEPNSQTDVLISYASDGVARIWAPVIDEPTQLRLWCSVEGSTNAAAANHDSQDGFESFYLDPYILSAALRLNLSILQREMQMIDLGLGSSAQLDAHKAEMDMDLRRTRIHRLEQLASETPDMLVSFDADGFMTLTAVANIDRRPPTLLQAFTVLRIPSALPANLGTVCMAKLLPLHVAPDSASDAPMLTLHLQFKGGQSLTYAINPATFFDGRGSGITLDTCHPCAPPASLNASPNQRRTHASRIERLTRSADGNHLVSSSRAKSISWNLDASTSQLQFNDTVQDAAKVASSSDALLTAYLLANGSGKVRSATDGAEVQFACQPDVQLLVLGSLDGDDILIATSDIGVIHSWKIESSRDLRLGPKHESRLFGEDAPTRRLAVVQSAADSSSQQTNLALVSSDTSGLIEVRTAQADTTTGLRWVVKASFSQASLPPKLISCSSDGLIALLYCDDQEVQTLVILNPKTASFNSGQEYRHCFESAERIIALDWSPSTRSTGALAVVFEHHVRVLCPGRISMFDELDEGMRTSWHELVRLDLRSCTPSSIRAACWLNSEQLVVASGSVLYVNGPWINSSIQETAKQETKHLAELLAEVGGPVVQYHPAFLLQCAQWGKMSVAKAIIGNLEKAALACNKDEVAETWGYEEIPIHQVLQNDASGAASKAAVADKHVDRQTHVFDDDNDFDAQADEDPFAAARIEKLVQVLQNIRPPHLTPADLDALVSIVKTIGETVREHRTLDASGVRYFIALRHMTNGRATPKPDGTASQTGLGYRDFSWALHSENQETLLACVEQAYGNKLDWSAARATGIFAWLKNSQLVRTQAEAVARAQFMSSEDRDPVKCSLLYYALGKHKVVQGLWRQAVWHPEQKKMLTFLAKDFDEERWRTAAQKNAFALLSQRRYEFAASFFMLGDSLRDAVNVCVRNMDDLALAIALARIKEGGDEGPVFRELLQTRVLPLAFERGDRWMGSWAFWMLKRRDLAVRIIVTPLRDLLADPGVASLVKAGTTCGDDNHNDPALALLFAQLRSKSLQTIKGLYDIPEKKIFDFVLTTNTALCRMGCHSLGLSLLRNWQFEPPSVTSASTLFHRVSKHDLHTLSRVDEAMLESTDAAPGQAENSTLHRRTSQTTMSPPSSPRMARRRSSLLQRRSSIINDLDIASVQSAQTDTAGKLGNGLGVVNGDQPRSEEPVDTNTAREPTSDAAANKDKPKKQGISIFKSAAASNSQQGAQEFDFGSFGF
ncbi:wd repeat protein [Moesziomyces antarcticus]|uniref:Related to RAV1 - Regulator of (H+)-ATPase in vacuolar membrane n=1 Tax=Pseudozyma antarctica TaxID=84753 RepID=A0A5C3FFT6_PSEA2|nr:wd repeat protein [Moesziomyces antarcticus]GAK61863.1 wd repeat protein [Moesziomyces antarcticus]SPO42381.1 related to RAV1 - Regulator of (H+)-ATPase in vacuolar membrane [Moesziomyces antarcticus]